MTDTTSQTPGTTPAATVDTRMMAITHTAHRREIGLAAGLVRAVNAGDRRRVDIIAEHVTLCLALLDHHLALEDTLLWPLLREREPPAATVFLERTVRGHEQLTDLLERARALLPAWRRTADPGDAAALAAGLDDLAVAVSAQFDAEETDLMPLLTRTVTAHEWSTFVERGAEPVPASMMSVVLGMLLYEADPAAVTATFPTVPAPLRRLLLASANRSFRRYATTIHATATPARSTDRR